MEVSQALLSIFITGTKKLFFLCSPERIKSVSYTRKKVSCEEFRPPPPIPPKNKAPSQYPKVWAYLIQKYPPRDLQQCDGLSLWYILIVRFIPWTRPIIISLTKPQHSLLLCTISLKQIHILSDIPSLTHSPFSLVSQPVNSQHIHHHIRLTNRLSCVLSALPNPFNILIPFFTTHVSIIYSALILSIFQTQNTQYYSSGKITPQIYTSYYTPFFRCCIICI